MEAVKEDVLRLVEAQIAGCVDLSPEEMVDAAFIMVDKINQKLYDVAPHDVAPEITLENLQLR